MAIVGLATPSSDPTKWQALRERAANSSLHSNNGTDAVYGEENNAPPLEMAAIGQYASNRDAVALDKTGQGKPKWYLHFDETVFKFNSRTNVNALNGIYKHVLHIFLIVIDY